MNYSIKKMYKSTYQVKDSYMIFWGFLRKATQNLQLPEHLPAGCYKFVTVQTLTFMMN